MENGRIPKDLLYGELETGRRPTGQPQLRYKDICKRDLQAHCINTNYWEVAATERDDWRLTIKLLLSHYEETQRVKVEEKCFKKTVCLASGPAAFIYSKFGRVCHS